MIDNKLTFTELAKIFRPVLGLKHGRDFISEIEDVFNTKINTVNDIYDYMSKYRISYEGFWFSMSNLECNDYGHIHIQTQFRIEKKWWYDFKRPEKNVIESIKTICQGEIQDLEFLELQRSYLLSDRNGSKMRTFKYYHDSRAFNVNHTEDGITISPLIIGYSENDLYRFVQFHFNALCYEEINEIVQLRKDWPEYMVN